MFKANLIEDPEYYRLRRNLLLVGVPSSILMGSVSFIVDIPLFWSVMVLVLALGVMIFQYRLRKGISIIAKNRRLEISPEKITIKSRSGEVEEEINLEKVDRIIVKEIYAIPEENLRVLFQEMKGDAEQQKNFLIVEQPDQARRLDFVMDSYYMIEQMKKLIRHWQSRGYRIETAGQVTMVTKTGPVEKQK